MNIREKLGDVAEKGLSEENTRKIRDFVFYSQEDRPLANKVICFLLLLSIVVCCVLASFIAISKSPGLMATMTSSVYEYGFFTLANIIAIELSAIGMFMMVHFDRRGQYMYARYTARIVVILIIASMLAGLAVNGMMFVEFFYLFQFACVIAYQVFNDPNLSFDAPWYNPFSRKARAASKEDILFKRDKYMPMNFFNLFWVFMIGCVVGIVVETWFCWFERGVIEDRAGLLFGPFSPIYGFGAVLMTVALNRFWNKSPIVIFVVSGLIGAGFECFTSWYMEVAFGISAWDYSDAFMNFDGRTDLAHAIAWGALGFIWIRFLLPVTMRLVDAIKLNWRAVLTVSVFALMLVNATMTLLALDSWSSRTEGKEVQPGIQEFYATYFDDEWMASRFQTMTLRKDGPVHSQIEGEIEAASSRAAVDGKSIGNAIPKAMIEGASKLDPSKTDGGGGGETGDASDDSGSDGSE